jgi:cullin 3
MAEFERYYHHRHSGRRLTWQSNHGTADVRVAFKARKHELNVSTHCLVILLLFEELVDGDDLSLQVNIVWYYRFPRFT